MNPTPTAAPGVAIEAIIQDLMELAADWKRLPGMTGESVDAQDALREALRTALLAGAAGGGVDNWIPVTDRLPEREHGTDTSREVIIFGAQGMQMRRVNYEHQHKDYDYGGPKIPAFDNSDATHWMDKPPAPGAHPPVPARAPQAETFESLWNLFSQHMANFNANRDNTQVRAEIDALLSDRVGAGALPASPLKGLRMGPWVEPASPFAGFKLIARFDTEEQAKAAKDRLAATPPSAAPAAPTNADAQIRAAAEKLDAAMRCHPKAVETLVAEALAILDGDVDCKGRSSEHRLLVGYQEWDHDLERWNPDEICPQNPHAKQRPLFAAKDGTPPPGEVQVDAARELLSISEQRAVLADLMGLECLINRHDCWIVEAEGRDMDECVPHHEKRLAELLGIGRAIIAEDPGIYDDDQKAAFKLRDGEVASTTPPVKEASHGK